MKALVVAGRGPIRDVVMDILAQRGHEAVVVDTADAARVACEEGGFPLVLIDGHVPGTEDPELRRRLRSLPGGEEAALLVLASQPGPGDIEAMLDRGDAEYANRPVEPGFLGVHLAYIERQLVERARREEAEEALAHERYLLGALMENLPDPIYFKDTDSRFTRLNWATATALGVDHPDHAVGKTDFDFFPESLARGFFEDERHVLENGQALHNRLEPQTTGPRVGGWLLTSKAPVHDRHGQIVGLVGNAKDVTERERAAEALAGYRRVLERLAAGEPLEEVLNALCHHLEVMLEGALCSVLLVDETGCRLRHGAAPSLPTDYSIAIDGSEIGPSVGSCGTAAYRREPVIVEDITVDRRWATFRALALEHGLRACWSIPIQSAATDRVLGTFAVYYREPRTPGEAELAEVMEATHLAGVAIQGRRAEAALHHSEARFRSLVEHASDLISVVNAEGIRRYVSPSYERVLGYRVEDLLGRPMADLNHPDDADANQRFLTGLAGRPGAIGRFEVRVLHRDGGTRWLEASVTNRLDDPNVQGFVVNSRDVTDRKALETQLAHQAFYDPLTGLANRTLFMDRLEQALSADDGRHGSVAVLFLDLDGFKVVNDSLGHGAGDRLLAAVADRLATDVRAEETVARLGGDEFAVLLPSGARGTGPCRVARRLLTALERPFDLEGGQTAVRASIGIARSAPGFANVSDILRAADVALYRAKALGKNRFAVFDPDQDELALDRLGRESDLRRALEQGELRLVYQPIVDLHAGRVVGAEALVRWQHPTRGVLLPAAFVPLAEETGLIVPLGRWVLTEACTHARAWQRQLPYNPPPRLYVNLAAHEFQQPSFPEELARTLEDTGLAPSHLTLEITESAAIADEEGAVSSLVALKSSGVRVAIDEFGTGYAALSSLKRFPIDEIKIDATFVAGAGTDNADSAIVRAVSSVADALGLTVTAERIETEEQATALRDLGCAQGQGRFFAPPLSWEAFADWLDQVEGSKMISTRMGRS